METVAASQVNENDLKLVDEIVHTMGAESALGNALHTLACNVRLGSDVVLAPASQPLTPAEACKFIGVSRTHLYKIMDRGELKFSRVGRDRRLEMTDVLDYLREKDERRRGLAERFAHADRDRNTLLAGMAGLSNEEATEARF